MEISKLIKLFRVNLKLFIQLILKNRKKRNSKILRNLLIDKLKKKELLWIQDCELIK